MHKGPYHKLFLSVPYFGGGLYFLFISATLAQVSCDLSCSLFRKAGPPASLDC